MTSPICSEIAASGRTLSAGAVESLIQKAFPAADYSGKKVLLVIPDSTRTAPVGQVFKFLHRQIGRAVSRVDILVALGTHAPMSEEAICSRLEISIEERRSQYGAVAFYNHEWDNPASLKTVGVIPSEDIRKLSDGLFSMEVPVSVNKRLFEYDQVILIGPVFPHEVAGFSGGNKYLFPGVAGPEIVNFFHWLGAVVTNIKIIGQKWTPVRRVVDRAGAMVSVPKKCICMVVEGKSLAGLFIGTPESAWDQASDLSAQHHITYVEKPFHTILSCAPTMYDELWTGGKCMYKLEPVLAEGGELIIYAPHIHEISVTHGAIIEAVGYHCRDFFRKQWDLYKSHPWGVLAHSTHVYGGGTYENGVEKPRAHVTLATGISKELCHKINLGYRDPASIRPSDYAGREKERVLMVPKAGEMLYRIRGS